MAKAKRKKHSKKSRSSRLNSKLYAILSGKSHRVVARSTKLVAARRRARGLIKRGSKHVSIRRGSKSFAVGAAKRTSRKRRSKKRTSKRRTSKRRRGSSRRRVSRNGRRRSKRSRRHSKRRSSRRGR
jgi:hypothetical protein